jgi:prepilin-type N-terminal cleavage/methylation domain-containing protein
MSVRRGSARRGLTLLEVVISVAIIALLLGSLLTFFFQTLTIREEAARLADRTNLVQQILQRMADEMQATIGVESVNFPVTQFRGDRRSVTFLMAPLPPQESYALFRQAEEAPPPRHDLREITYSLWIDPEETTEDGEPLVGGILRTERRVFDPFETEDDVAEEKDLQYLRRDLWSPELGYLEFRYFDGVEWSTRWEVTEGNPLPHLVQITVGLDSIRNDDLEDQDLEQFPLDQYPLGPDEPEPGRYRLIVRLQAADDRFTARARKLGDQVEEVYGFGGLDADAEAFGGGEEFGGGDAFAPDEGEEDER